MSPMNGVYLFSAVGKICQGFDEDVSLDVNGIDQHTVDVKKDCCGDEIWHNATRRPKGQLSVRKEKCIMPTRTS